MNKLRQPGHSEITHKEEIQSLLCDGMCTLNMRWDRDLNRELKISNDWNIYYIKF